MKNNCPSCGSTVNIGDSFCGVCGTKLTNVTINNMVNNQPSNMMNIQSNTDVNNSTNNYNQGVSAPINNSQKPISQNSTEFIKMNENYDVNQLIDAYIGKNANKFRQNKFSIWMFLFGMYYVVYRKMWLTGIGWFLINFIITLFLGPISSFLSFIVNIILCFNFNKMYLNHAQDEVSKIINSNPSLSSNALMINCSNKGGTSIAAVIILAIIYLGLDVLSNNYIGTNFNNITSIKTIIDQIIGSL